MPLDLPPEYNFSNTWTDSRIFSDQKRISKESVGIRVYTGVTAKIMKLVGLAFDVPITNTKGEVTHIAVNKNSALKFFDKKKDETNEYLTELIQATAVLLEKMKMREVLPPVYKVFDEKYKDNITNWCVRPALDDCLFAIKQNRNIELTTLFPETFGTRIDTLGYDQEQIRVNYAQGKDSILQDKELQDLIVESFQKFRDSLPLPKDNEV